MKLKNRYIMILGLVVLIMAAVSLFYPLDTLLAGDEAAGRIAFVDVQAVFNIHPDKKTAEEELNKIAQSMQSELEQEAEELPKEQQQDLVNDYQGRLTQQEQELIQQILVKIDKAIRQVAEEQEVRLVLDKKNVIYGGYDMTQDVIDYINNNVNADESIEETGEESKEETQTENEEDALENN